MPDALGSLAPQSDLRTVLIRRTSERVAANDAPRNSGAADIFFAKGNATADGFRPSYWTYDRYTQDETPSTVAAAPDKADTARTDLALMESAFLDSQNQLLNSSSRPADDEAIQTDAAGAPRELEGLAPEADLRSIVIRHGARSDVPGAAAAELIDDLFVKKGHATAVAREPDAAEGGAAPAQGETERLEQPAEAVPQCERQAIVSAAEPSAAERAGRRFVTLLAFALAFACLALFAILTPYLRSVPAKTSDASVSIVAEKIASPPPPPAVPNVLIGRGDERLIAGDLLSARLFYQRAAEEGSGRAALMVGMTFDPSFLASRGVYGLAGDEKEAMAWYRRARDLGEPEAEKLLRGTTPTH